MINKVFFVSGNKISCFIADDTSLKFSSHTAVSYDDFLTSWNKKLSLNTKQEIKYEKIKSVKKEENAKDVVITYRSALGIPLGCIFSFNREEDYPIFAAFLERERYFTKTVDRMTPFRAILSHLVGLIIVASISIFAYFEAIALANGTAQESENGKAWVFDKVVGTLGEKGVLAIGIVASAFFLYKIWTRFTNPPNQEKLLPPNA